MNRLCASLGATDRSPSDSLPERRIERSQRPQPAIQARPAKSFEDDILEAEERFEAPGITLSAATPRELPVDPARIVPLGQEDREPAALGDAFRERDIRASTGHVGRDRDPAHLPRARKSPDMAESRSDKTSENRTAKPQPKVNWDDSNMDTSYANVVNAASTREEVILLFGTNQSWKGVEDEVDVHLSNRIILNPYAAKRLAILLGGVVSQYEKRFGTLGVDVKKQ